MQESLGHLVQWVHSILVWVNLWNQFPPSLIKKIGSLKAISARGKRNLKDGLGWKCGKWSHSSKIKIVLLRIYSSAFRYGDVCPWGTGNRQQAKTHFMNSTIYPWCVLMCSIGLTITNNRMNLSCSALREICCRMFNLRASVASLCRELPEENHYTSSVTCWHEGQEYTYSLDLASCLFLRNPTARFTDNLPETRSLTPALFKPLSMLYCFVSFKPIFLNITFYLLISQTVKEQESI